MGQTPRGGRASRANSRARGGRGRGRGREDRDSCDNSGELNANLSERIGRASSRPTREAPSSQLPVVLNQRIGQYLRKKPIARGAPDWTSRPEIPSIEELLPYDSFPSSFPSFRNRGHSYGWSSTGKQQAVDVLGWDDSPDFATWDDVSTKPDKQAKNRDDKATTSTDPAKATDNHSWDDTVTGADAWAESAPVTDGWGGTSQEHDAKQKASDHASWDDTDSHAAKSGTAKGFSPQEIANLNDPAPSTGQWDDDAQHGDDWESTNNKENTWESHAKDHDGTSRSKLVDETLQAEAVEDTKTIASESDLLPPTNAPAQSVKNENTLPSWDHSETAKDAWDVDTRDPWDPADSAKAERRAQKETAWEIEAHASESGHVAKDTGPDEWNDNPTGESEWDNPGMQNGTAEPWVADAAANSWDDTAAQSNAGPNKDGEQVDEGFDTVLNKIEGPWASKAEYLRNHYLLLREDSLRDLRNKLRYFRENPDLREDPSTQGLGIYDQVHVCGITFSNRGLGLRVSFSLGRVGKRVRWEQSPRLKTGTLVILMTPDNTICKVAVVAARTLENLSRDPPEVDLFMARGEDMDLDCSQEWIMLEERSAYFEAQRHTMTALQRMMREDFPLQEHLVNVEPTVNTPAYLDRNPERDLTELFNRPTPQINLLEEWPVVRTTLDESQVGALKRILTKKLALVQGPPGTGKTYVSVQALKVLLANMGAGDPPIVITCQTNHALDQLLRHVAEFEPQFARLGGQTQDKEIVGKRTIYELKGAKKSHHFKEFKEFEALKHEIAELISPLIKGSELEMDTLDLDQLERLNLLNGLQVQSLKRGAEKWKTHDTNPSKSDPLVLWVGERNLEPVSARRLPILVGWETEELEVEMEEVQEADAENVAKDDDDDIERLRGEYYQIGDTWTGKCLDAKTASKRAESALKANNDLYKIKTNERGAVYRHLQTCLKAKIKERLVQLWPRYEALVEARKIWTYESHEVVLREQKVIGMTTTGLSKYRGLIAAIQPKVVLIEEAAETMEAPVIAGCVESVEHLILVGDHKQLRAHCNVSELERAPYYLNISLFERLVINGLEYSLLRRQRRMKPEIRRMLLPIYGEKIKDHKKVHEQAMVPGMGGLTSWFFTHEGFEARDEDFSVYNPDEASMILGLVQYLVYNGMQASEITILTFYRAQVRCLQKTLRSFTSGAGIKIVTVDSYQGEENEVVILSLVRSNPEGKIGFVANENRTCVALSRAKRGFFLFGNAECVAGESRVWSKVLVDLRNGSVGKEIREDVDPKHINPHLPRRRVGFVLPIWCAKHKWMTFIKSHHDWAENVGGCNAPCRGRLDCGHFCPEKCHPWDHSSYNNCRAPCKEILNCGHPCSLPCKEIPHICKACATKEQIAQLDARSRTQEHPGLPVVESDADRPLSPGSSKASEARMGRLLDADFEGLNVGGDGYTYDNKNRPVVQGHQNDSHTYTPKPSRSPREHFDEVYKADVHARETAHAKPPQQLSSRPKVSFHQDVVGADEEHTMSGALQPDAAPSQTSLERASRSSSKSRVDAGEDASGSTHQSAQHVAVQEEEIDLLGGIDGTTSPFQPPAPSQYQMELSLLD